MTKIDIFSGFLGAGKTTLIKKLIAEAYAGEKLVLIENEFGEIGIDGAFMQDAGIEVTEMNSGCICCSLVGDFGEALKKVLAEYAPDRIIIEPSGVGKLSDVIKAVKDVDSHEIILNSFTTIADANKCKLYMKNFGEFYNNQIENANCIILSRTQDVSEDKLAKAIELIKQKNDHAVIVITPWDDLEGKTILEAMENKETLAHELEELEHKHRHHHHDHDEEYCCGHDHHHDHEDECCCGHDHHHDHEEECCCGHDNHHDHDEECCCGHDHHHDHDDECCCGHDHHHDHDDECCCGHEHHHYHEHHHHHEEECTCGCHGHEHHHHADEVFMSWGKETIKKFSIEDIENILEELDDEAYGIVLRAKGVVAGCDGSWIHFDHVPGEADVRTGSAGVIGRLCVIGSKLNEDKLEKLFGVK